LTTVLPVALLARVARHSVFAKENWDAARVMPMSTESLQPGDVLTSMCVISPRDVQTFGELVGDLSAHHLPSTSDRQVAHGLHVLSLVTRVGTPYNFVVRHLACDFMNRAIAGDRLSSKVHVQTVASAGALGCIIEASFIITNQRDITVMTGTISGIAKGVI
jgi:acyl dehydratase